MNFVDDDLPSPDGFVGRTSVRHTPDTAADFATDPFSPEADPYPQAPAALPLSTPVDAGAHDCHCARGDPSLSRRQALAGAALVALSPLVARAETITPCVQIAQKPQPCRHKFCRYYAGDGDYHGR